MLSRLLCENLTTEETLNVNLIPLEYNHKNQSWKFF